MKKVLTLACAIAAPLLYSQSALAEFDYLKTDGTFKRFSVSAGWLHAAPQGHATPVQNTTAVPNGTQAENGEITVGTVTSIIDPNQDPATIDQVNNILGSFPDTQELGPSGLDISGYSVIDGLESFATLGTGLESDRTDTVGLLFNYFINDNWSIETKAGIPPTVDILGKGEVVAPLRGSAHPEVGEIEFDIYKDIYITDLTQGDGVASSARAWLPAAEVHYQFGKSGVNRLRPYVGVGVIYAYFNDIELNSGIRNDLEMAGHQIQNIKDGQAGASLNNVPSSSGMHVNVEADDALAPIFTVGTTYDFNENWFAVGSLTYANLDSDSTITVENDAGEELIRAVSNIEIDPYISYLGVGYRF